ncbi:MAG: hypothetical protein ACREEL_14345 [Stellaceae bacterium]
MLERAVAPGTGLTPTDIRLIGRFADQMVRAGKWRAIYHANDLFCEYFAARLEDAKHSRLMIGVLHGRHYFCMDDRTSAVYVDDTLPAVLRRAGLPVPIEAGVSSSAEKVALGVTRNQ